VLITIDPSSPAPLYRQIAEGIRRAVDREEVKPGERLPAARQLARLLEVNMHTVLRAYADLRDQGLVELRRGRGAVVVEGPGPGWLAEAARRLVTEAQRRGLEGVEVVAAVADAARHAEQGGRSAGEFH
jgi:GntR family transcriptional regulator